jgi:pimeloyl-ACP methyl ester carboxylesterase
VRDVLGGFVGRRPVIAADLPGHGETPIAGPTSVGDCAEILEAALANLGMTDVDLVSDGGAWVLATELVRRMGPRVRRLAICDPFLTPQGRAQEMGDAAPDLRADWSGSHLMRIWHFARDQSTAWPWCDRSARAALAEMQPEEPHVVHQRAVDLLRATDSFPASYRTLLAAAEPEAIAAFDERARLFASPGAPCRRLLGALTPLPPDRSDWSSAQLDHLSS